jgi:uncharacterized protein (TIGR00255 family)
MKSMTGFGRAERSSDGISVSLQVSSVNRKNMEVVCSLPKEFQHLERKVVEFTRARAGRGRFQFSLEIRNERNAAVGLPSDVQIDAGLDRLKDVLKRRGLADTVDATTIVNLAKLIETETPKLPKKVVEQLLLGCVEAALDELVAMRVLEGAALKLDLGARCQSISDTILKIKVMAPGMVAKYRENLHGRLAQSGLEIDLDDERVLKEIALYSDRSDISEEMTRLDSHLEQFVELLKKDEPVGRSIEFLVQEIGREINTTGSKSCSIEISKNVLAMKNELERIREQVANVE